VLNFRILTFLFLGVSTGCDTRAGPPTPTTVPEGMFAVVGKNHLPLPLLSQSTSSLRASEAKGIVSDELFALDAKKRLPQWSHTIERGVLARALLERWEQEALQERTINDETLEAERSKLWLRYDRPRSVRTGEFFVPVRPMENEEPAYALATQIHTAVLPALNIDDFAMLGRAVETQLEPRSHMNPPVAADGRVIPLVPQDAKFEWVDENLAQGATALTEVGQVSPVIATKGGFHILYVTEITPAERPPLSKIRLELLKESLSVRVRQEQKSMKANSRAKIVRVREDLAFLLRPVWRRQ